MHFQWEVSNPPCTSAPAISRERLRGERHIPFGHKPVEQPKRVPAMGGHVGGLTKAYVAGDISFIPSSTRHPAMTMLARTTTSIREALTVRRGHVDRGARGVLITCKVLNEKQAECEPDLPARAVVLVPYRTPAWTPSDPLT